LKPYQQRLAAQEPITASEQDDGSRVLCRENDVCTFLRDDNRCALHAALGPKTKPQGCIDFPFAWTETPAGAYAGLSFACTAVLQNHGRPVEERAGELAENYTESTHVHDASGPVQLTARIAISFAAYLEIERALDELLSLGRVPLPRRVL